MRGFFILVLICLFLALCNPEAGAEDHFQNSQIFQKNRKIKENQLYSALGGKNYKKILEITEELLKETPDDKKLLVLALENSMATKDWTKAFFYNDKLLQFEPNSPCLLKNEGDLYSIAKDFPNAIKFYEKLVDNYPTLEYKLTLANLYIENQDFVYAQVLLEPIYNINPDNTQIAEAYLKSLIAQRKIRQAYWVVKNNHLENTEEGYMVLGDMAMMDKNYEAARGNYTNALAFDPESLTLKNKIAQSSRILKNINNPNLLDRDVEKNSNILETELGFEDLEMIKNNSEKSRVIFYDLLSANPNYIPTKTGLTRSYLGTSHDFDILEALKKMPQNDKTKLIKAQTYYDMNMWSDAKEVLKGVATKEAEELRYKIRRDEAITLIPSYSFFFQQLADEFDLDTIRGGILLSKNINENRNVFMEYNVIVYTSGGPNRLHNVTNEFRGGIKSRSSEKWEYRADLGVKVFEFDEGDMIITDSWIKHYFNDKFNLKLGFRRNNLEQSYLSAVGRPVGGVFTGRAADNKFYLEFNRILPHKLYAFGFGSYGVICAQNLPTNQYGEGMVGLGRLLYNNPKNKWLNTVGVDVVSYNSAYQYNLLRVSESPGVFFGGYFSPSYFNATTLNLRLEGRIKKWHLKYGIDTFGGIQTAMSPDMTGPAWGIAPYISYDLNDNIAINLAYDHYVYAGIQRDQFIVNAVIRGFKKHVKN